MTQAPVPQSTSVITSTDGSLAHRIRCGDREALGEVYDRYGAAAFATVVRDLGDAQRAEDVVHDGFVAVWREIDRFNPSRGSLRAWLLGLVRARSSGSLGLQSPSMKVRGGGASPAAPERGAARILVIDDDRDVGEA